MTRFDLKPSLTSVAAVQNLATKGGLQVGRLRGDIYVYVLAAVPVIVVALVVVLTILSAGASAGPQALPLPQPAPVGP
jgi:hypothetical protein